MIQSPKPEDFLLKWRGDTLTVTLTLTHHRKGRAAFRTNIGNARIRRREIIAETDRGETPLAKAWHDIPMEEVVPGVYKVDIPLNEVGIFSGKACFFAEGSYVPEWPEGANTHIKVVSAETRKNNSIYCVFPRQFGSFREIVRRLPHIMDRMGFGIIQTLPPFPVPTTYAVMGEYGCPFAATDFLSVDPAMAEFDEYATPLDQFKELIGAVHAKKGLMFIDLPANHTGWASTLQTHHPDWFNREADGHFISPGAWGVKWADLVELDYSNNELRTYMADVFIFWCRIGVDGFRCDAGYMIPQATWEYIVARVREEYPDTIFMLEGLGGDIKVTDSLLAVAGLDWAYSEIFQTYDRNAFEWYLPEAIRRSEKYGTLVHFAETHDNDRLAKGGERYARLRVTLAAMLSWQGAWGIANGVEWLCEEKIDVHGKNKLNWGSEKNIVDLIARLNLILTIHPNFAGAGHLEVITRGVGNTLAVRRDDILILANLDCENGVNIDWEHAKDKHSGYDLITGRKCNLDSTIWLEPGEVLAVADSPLEETAKSDADSRGYVEMNSPTPLFHIMIPRDENRDVVVPEGQWVEVSAPSHFRMRLTEPQTNKTIRVFRSNDHRVVFDAPHYKGDGTKCRELYLDVSIYSNDGRRAERMRSRFLVPPTEKKAAVKLALFGNEVRQNPDYRTILSNGAGASSQMRIGFGRIASQYDAIFAANPNPNVPSDRINLWSRMRCWLQREGYTRELDSKCVIRFTADPAGKGAKWDFRVPCGMGKETAFAIEVSLANAANAVRMRVTRYDVGENDIGDQVRLVFRPDIEWRSFHTVTKAFMGAERLFPKATRETQNGFIFSPYDEKFEMRLENGIYHHEEQWSYNVAHPEEAERGQDGAGDLFSPGWISADLKLGETTTIYGLYGDLAVEKLNWGMDNFSALSTQAMGEALKRAIELYIVKRDEFKTIIAGYPWFLDWGRDTFIFMRGMIAAGKIADSVKILKAFAAFEENGTLPNIIYGKTAGNRDTTDAQLWFIRCVQELGEKGAKIRPTCESIVDNYIKGTPNGIKMDEESGLIWSPSHFTWMDTNYPACTPRVGYPIEIQALWISALRFLGRDELAEKALSSVTQLFKIKPLDHGKGMPAATMRGYYDCLSAPNGESAFRAVPEDTIRPNQLFLITLGILKDKSILEATEELLIPGGIRSLSSGNPLYCGVYTGDENTSRKLAYHNGTAWAWQFPLYAEALVEMGVCSKAAALQLLAGAVENINSGCIGHISEVADGDAPHRQKGCTAQAWSDSELLRVWLRLGGK